MEVSEFQKILKKEGFKHKKGNGGSHQKYINPTTNRTISLPVTHKDLKIGLELRLFKDAGIDRNKHLK